MFLVGHITWDVRKVKPLVILLAAETRQHVVNNSVRGLTASTGFEYKIIVAGDDLVFPRNHRAAWMAWRRNVYRVQSRIKSSRCL